MMHARLTEDGIYTHLDAIEAVLIESRPIPDGADWYLISNTSALPFIEDNGDVKKELDDSIQTIVERTRAIRRRVDDDLDVYTVPKALDDEISDLLEGEQASLGDVDELMPGYGKHVYREGERVWTLEPSATEWIHDSRIF